MIYGLGEDRAFPCILEGAPLTPTIPRISTKGFDRPRRMKNIFIGYSKTCKMYVYISKHNKGSVFKFESRDTTFLDIEFFKTVDIGSDYSQYELLDEVEFQLVHSSGINDTTNDEFVPRSSNSTPAETIVPDSLLLIIMLSVGAVWILFLSGSNMNETDLRGRELLGRTNENNEGLVKVYEGERCLDTGRPPNMTKSYRHQMGS